MSGRDLVLSRRALLVAGIVTLAGCRAHRAASHVVDPDAAAWTAARDAEAALVAAFAALAASSDSVAPVVTIALAHHRAHLAALGGGPAPSAAPVAHVPDVAPTVPMLQQAAITVRSGAKAAVLASIAASHLAESTRP